MDRGDCAGRYGRRRSHDRVECRRDIRLRSGMRSAPGPRANVSRLTCWARCSSLFWRRPSPSTFSPFSRQLLYFFFIVFALLWSSSIVSMTGANFLLVRRGDCRRPGAAQTTAHLSQPRGEGRSFDGLDHGVAGATQRSPRTAPGDDALADHASRRFSHGVCIRRRLGRGRSG